ncbi:hypothetical protein SODALDRAFT_363737 [Sodiomyces alkalinus F11]|uniref:Uncharacterized protein n=1 Tax=Sodiomyces alkalinus (strain CBS 110278 / VKM F-3762 / F11) TaxID=1314773 RepID=A0A3N2PKL2_SODAK|nr:hypothetical protein SODALDRAFT_363737 [Sodiomyces alkalinus F11]ROT35049.1 hypothetical protein SODALDRAFT_363737 [Sodiomyces alkalinus F11]
MEEKRKPVTEIYVPSYFQPIIGKYFRQSFTQPATRAHVPQMLPNTMLAWPLDQEKLRSLLRALPDEWKKLDLVSSLPFFSIFPSPSPSPLPAESVFAIVVWLCTCRLQPLLPEPNFFHGIYSPDVPPPLKVTWAHGSAARDGKSAVSMAARDATVAV